jgi:hypothetical protein
MIWLDEMPPDEGKARIERAIHPVHGGLMERCARDCAMVSGTLARFGQPFSVRRTAPTP